MARTRFAVEAELGAAIRLIQEQKEEIERLRQIIARFIQWYDADESDPAGLVFDLLAVLDMMRDALREGE